MSDTVAAAIATNRFGLGACPGDLARVATDPRGALHAQLAGAAPLLPGANLPDSAEVVERMAELRLERAQSRQRAASESDDTAAAPPPAVQKLGALLRPMYIDDAAARVRAGVTTDRPMLERLVHFWSNHFAVSVDKQAVLGLAGAFEREAIRPHVLGSFRELLLAVERHPAMLLYLDNVQSVGPNSDAARKLSRRALAGRAPRRKAGINENLAREILELHTLGVDGGYSQADVTEFAKVLSGWSIGGGTGRLRGGDPGRFYFREALHEPGSRHLLGRSYRDAGESQGVAVLQDLAGAGATAQHIATKLCRHFIADDPPPAAVARVARTFLDTSGDLPSVYRALVDAPESWAEPLSKYKTPSDYIYSTYRALQLPVAEGAKALAPFELLGQRNFSPGSPAGWPDRAADWDGSAALLKRLEWADQLGQRIGSRIAAAERATQVLGATLSEHTRVAVARAESGMQALTLLLASPEFMRR
ncbi:MAG TPA: DUF1800 domain-containing protein [Steroidobacteraceae bacterium]|nr:DUF1800 domain-containing protein [Steroidobacteraceae bacterium]